MVLEGGTGPPLLLLHGGIDSGGAYWAPVIFELAESHSLVVPDLPGLGESEPLARLDSGAFADWFTELVQSTCGEEPTLIAHSLLATLPHESSLGMANRPAHRDLRRARDRALPNAAGTAGGGDPVRPAAHGANEERFERRAFHDLDRARRRDPEWFEAWSAYTPPPAQSCRTASGLCAG